MERNTFATSVYVEASPEDAFAYLRRLEHLDEWTLGSRMRVRIDDDTWMGTASGYQSMLCYHVNALSDVGIPAIEWQCGYTFKSWFKQYPVLVLPSALIDPDGDERGAHLHWVSVIDPVQRTPMIMEGIETVHRFEARALKAAIERRAGLATPATSRHRVETDTIYVDAPLEDALAFVADVRRLPEWSPLFRPDGEPSREEGRFVDEYDQRVEASFRVQPLGGDYGLVVQDFRYPADALLQRCLFLLIPSERAFGASARGLILHRIAFYDSARPPVRGRVRIEDFGAENMACKRILEAEAGNVETFAKGMSYAPDPETRASGRSRGAPPNVFGEAFFLDPYPAYAAMRRDYPLYFEPTAGAWILSRYEDVRLALSDPAFTTESYAAQTEPLLGRTIIQLDGREHTRQRNLISATFRAGNVAEHYAALIGDTVDALLDPIASSGRAELMGDFVQRFPVRIMAGILGLPDDDLERFRRWYTGLIRGALNIAGDPDVAAAGERARDELDAYLRNVLAERRRAPGTDMISSLAAAELDGATLSDEEIVRFGMLMVFAAGETTEKALATTLRNLVARPELLERVAAERALVPRVIEESLRYTAPTHMVPRRTAAEVTVSGGVIPAGAEVMCFLGAANRDERRFAAPDTFDPFRAEHDRALTSASQGMHLAFGAGRHFCPGAALSRLELETALERVLDRLPGLRFTDDVVPEDRGLFLRCPAELPVVFTPEGD